jgi:predicted NBD/HSP70 family sugar kinase/beta-phosphoglucomutase-like phosphatase (HAD superfamily)
MRRAIILDKDGVLIETEDGKNRSYHQVVAGLLQSAAPPWEEYRRWHRQEMTGCSRQECAEGVVRRFPQLESRLLDGSRELDKQWNSGGFDRERYPEAAQEIERALQEFGFWDRFPASIVLGICRLMKYAELLREERCRPIGPMIETLRALQAEAIPTALATESQLDRTLEELRHIQVDVDAFRLVVCKDYVYRRGQLSPSPGKKACMYREIAREFGDWQCVTVEDTETGARAAAEGGIGAFLPCSGKIDDDVAAIIRAVCLPGETLPARLQPMLVGIDFGGSETKVQIGESLWFFQPGTFSGANEAHILGFLKTVCTSELNAQAVGIALATSMAPMPGPHSRPARRITERTTKFSQLAGIEGGSIAAIERRWSDELHTRVFILNDGEAAALAEHRQGAGRGADNLFVTNVGTSLSGGFVFHGRPVIGSYSSRASHMILEPSGAPCVGEEHSGCWKTVAGKDALIALAHEMGLPRDPCQVAAMARAGDRSAIECFERFAEGVARGMATIIGAVPVDRVVVGGGIARAGEVLFEPLIARLRRGDLLDRQVAAGLEIVPAECPQPVALGARLWAEAQSGLL